MLELGGPLRHRCRAAPAHLLLSHSTVAVPLFRFCGGHTKYVTNAACPKFHLQMDMFRSHHRHHNPLAATTCDTLRILCTLYYRGCSWDSSVASSYKVSYTPKCLDEICIFIPHLPARRLQCISSDTLIYIYHEIQAPQLTVVVSIRCIEITPLGFRIPTTLCVLSVSDISFFTRPRLRPCTSIFTF